VNPLPIEVALAGKQKDLLTVGVTSFEHSLRSQPKLPNGNRLLDVVDIAIDTHVPYGDAGLEVANLPMKIGPLSTLAGVTIVNAIIAETIEAILALRGYAAGPYQSKHAGSVAIICNTSRNMVTAFQN
jgi:uncharacterized phosphosugar-binding protein